LFSIAAHQTAAYTYDSVLRRNRYKSTNIVSSNVGFGDQRTLNTAGWAITNGTRSVNQTGIDGSANSCTLFTASSANATLLYAVTQAAATRTFSAFVKRTTGIGRVWITRNGGTTRQDITALINTETFTRVSMATSVLNPSLGFIIETSGDAIAIDAVSDTAGSVLYDPFISRGDQQGSTLVYGSLLPACTNGRRYELSVRVKVKDSGINFIAQNTAGSSFVRMNYDGNSGLFNVASASASVSPASDKHSRSA
jgi:hypothetical protein